MCCNCLPGWTCRPLPKPPSPNQHFARRPLSTLFSSTSTLPKPFMLTVPYFVTLLSVLSARYNTFPIIEHKMRLLFHSIIFVASCHFLIRRPCPLLLPSSPQSRCTLCLASLPSVYPSPQQFRHRWWLCTSHAPEAEWLWTSRLLGKRIWKYEEGNQTKKRQTQEFGKEGRKMATSHVTVMLVLTLTWACFIQVSVSDPCMTSKQAIVWLTNTWQLNWLVV